LAGVFAALDQADIPPPGQSNHLSDGLFPLVRAPEEAEVEAAVALDAREKREENELERTIEKGLVGHGDNS
jgi:hypothetical protein